MPVRKTKKTKKMKIETQIELNRGVYHALVRVLEWNSAETEAIHAHGPEYVQLGGSFQGSGTRPGEQEPTSVDFELPSRQRIMDTSPYIQKFDTATNDKADVAAQVWATVLVSRIVHARDNVLQKERAFEGQTIQTL